MKEPFTTNHESLIVSNGEKGNHFHTNIMDCMHYLISMLIRPLLVFWLIVYSIRYRTRPWNFFQLNGEYYNAGKKIFSKFDLDQCIPKRWRLSQIVDDGTILPQFPVFRKPDWGQNSHGVSAVNGEAELLRLRCKRNKKDITFLLQEAARESREFELFYIRSAENLKEYALFSVTETTNSGESPLPVNGVLNRETSYHDITALFRVDELIRLWGMISNIGFFKIARVGLRTDSINDLLEGKFHIIEINLFLPMPLMLLDDQITWSTKHQFIRSSMQAAAALAKTIVRRQKRYSIFFRQLVAHYQVKE